MLHKWTLESPLVEGWKTRGGMLLLKTTVESLFPALMAHSIAHSTESPYPLPISLESSPTKSHPGSDNLSIRAPHPSTYS